VKHYRPHIFVVVALAIVLSSGWHGTLSNALTDLRFGWVSRQATGDVVVIAIDAPSIEKIGVWPWPRPPPRRLAAAAGNRRVRDIVFDVDSARRRMRPQTRHSLKRCGARVDRWFCRPSSSREQPAAMERRSISIVR